MTVGCRNPCEDIERLKVCGTCGVMDDYYDWDTHIVFCPIRPSACRIDAEYDQMVEVHDSCHFTPSKWRPYWEE